MTVKKSTKGRKFVGEEFHDEDLYQTLLGKKKRPRKSGMVSFRCAEAQKERYEAAAKRLGYSDLTKFFIDLADAVSGPVVAEGWECRLLHLQSDRVVGVGEEPPSLPLPVPAFPVVAPSEFWKNVQLALKRQGGG